MGLKEEFDNAIRNSIKYKDDEYLNKNRNDNKYYDDKYAEPIKRYFLDKNIVSYEVNKSEKDKCTPICAFASSGRLCYLYFQPEGATFEQSLYNDINNSRRVPTKMDAVCGNINYECKCQEIVSKSPTHLTISYLNSDLFKELRIEEYETKLEEKKNKKTGKITKSEYLCFNVSELNINLKKNPDYAHLHFDLKQLICHLLAIAHENINKESILQYVFFTPSIEEIKKSKKVTSLYGELKDEWKAIVAPDSKITKFAKNHKISLLDPKYVPIDEIDDFNYREAFKK